MSQMFALVSHSRRNPRNVTRRAARRKRRTAFSMEMEEKISQKNTRRRQTLQSRKGSWKEERL